MKLALLPLFLIIACGGGGSGGSKNATPVFKIAYIYPENDMTPGQGERTVFPIGVACQNEKGEVVDNSNCPGIEDLVPHDGPVETQKSPAGLANLVIPNSEEGTISVEVGEGFSLDQLTDEERRLFLQDKVTCSPTYFMDYRGHCNDVEFFLTYSDWDTSSILACDGTGLATRTSTCVDAKTGLEADEGSSCAETPILSETRPSPVGQVTKTNLNGDTLNVICDEGKTVEDIGSGTTVVEVISCGSGRYINGLTCSVITYSPTEFVFPINDLNPGQGERTVTATGVQTCIEDHTQNSVDVSFCASYDLSEVTQLQKSPAGTVVVTQPNGDSITYNLGEGQTPSSEGVVGTITSCGADRHLVDDVCIDDVFIASDFTFPANNMAVGDGSRVVNANGFNTCRRQHNSELVSNDKCSIPSPAPTEIQLSPAGQITRNVGNANSNPVITLDVEEGELVSNDQINDALILALADIGCVTGYKINPGGNKCISKTMVEIEYNSNAHKVHLPTGYVNISPSSVSNPDSLTYTCEGVAPVPAGVTVNSDCSITGTISSEGAYEVTVKVDVTDWTSPWSFNKTVSIITQPLWEKISPASGNNCSNFDSLSSDALIEDGMLYCASSVGAFAKPSNTGSGTGWTFYNGAKLLTGYGVANITTSFPKTLNNSSMSFSITDPRGERESISKSWTFSHGEILDGAQGDTQMNILGVDEDGGVYVHLYYQWYTGIEGLQWRNIFVYFANGSNTPIDVYGGGVNVTSNGIDRKGTYFSGKFLFIPNANLMIDTTYTAGGYRGSLSEINRSYMGNAVGGYSVFRSPYFNALGYLNPGDATSSHYTYAPTSSMLKVNNPILYRPDRILVANGTPGNLEFFYVGTPRMGWGQLLLASHEYLPGPTGISGLTSILALGNAVEEIDNEDVYSPVYAFVIAGKIEFWKFNTYIADILE